MPDRPEEPTKRLVVEIADSLHYRLRMLAVQRRTTVANIVRTLIERETAEPQKKGDSLARHLAPPTERERAATKAG